VGDVELVPDLLVESAPDVELVGSEPDGLTGLLDDDADEPDVEVDDDADDDEPPGGGGEAGVEPEPSLTTQPALPRTATTRHKAVMFFMGGTLGRSRAP
jgi:hypothetical protein